MTTNRTQTKNLYWCQDNVYSGWTSLYFKPDYNVHTRIKYIGVGNWQYTGDGTWYILNVYRERVLTEFTRAGYRVKEISWGEAAGRQKVHNQRRGQQRDYYQERRQQEQRDGARRSREDPNEAYRRRERERREEEAKRQRERYEAFNSHFEDYFNNSFGQAKNNSKSDYKELEDAWLTIFYSLGLDHAKKLYRQAAQVLHPDRQGNEEAMKVLNTAWQIFENPNKVRR